MEGNAEQLKDFADSSFDSYTIAFGIRNVTDRDAALRQAYRVLKPGGRCEGCGGSAGVWGACRVWGAVQAYRVLKTGGRCEGCGGGAGGLGWRCMIKGHR